MAENEKSIHEGHRKRMYQRFSEQGFAGFSDHEVLECLLFLSCRRGDMNPVAHRLIEHFGSFSGVLQASEEDLKAVKGVGDSTARLLHLVMETIRYYEKARTAKPRRFESLEDIVERLSGEFYAEPRELVYAMFLDDRNVALAVRCLAEGSVNEAAFSQKEVVRQAVRLEATQVVLAHNHPCGVAVPSPEDLAVTRQLAVMLNNVGVSFLDHIIYDGRGQSLSLRLSGRGQYLNV